MGTCGGLVGNYAEGCGGVVVDAVGPGNKIGSDEGQGGAATGVCGAEGYDDFGLHRCDVAGLVEARFHIVYLRPGVM